MDNKHVLQVSIISDKRLQSFNDMASNPYDPVTTSDSTQLADDDWGLATKQYGYSRSRQSRFKIVFGELRHHKRAVLITVSAITVLVLIVIIIAVAATGGHAERHPTGQEDPWVSPAQGLVFYPIPEDKTILISFSPPDFKQMKPQPLKMSLDSVMKDYLDVNQLNEAVFVECNQTYTPGNKTCRVSRNMFGDECTSAKNYGYHGGQPCVFLQLNLPDGITIKPIGQDSPLWAKLDAANQDQLQDLSHVPVTCKGTEKLDTDILESVPGNGPKHERIMYYPKEGLLSYIYRPRNASLPFLKPGVMVQFTSLVSKRLVHITCTAWGQLYDSQNKLMNHQLLTTHFALFVNFSS